MDTSTQRILELGARRLEIGDARGAIEAFRAVLSVDPDHSVAHALLALALVHARRLHAAEHEARAALGAGPDLPVAHAAMGSVLRLRHRAAAAREHWERAVALEPDEPRWLRGLAHLHAAERRPDEARDLLDRALALDPDDAETLAALGDLALDRGRREEAEKWARAALGADPDGVEGLLLMGRVLLRAGDWRGAREHAAMALRAGATEQALHLLADAKARRSPVLGLWWRWSAWMGELGGKGAVVLLLSAYLAYRAAEILLDELGQPTAAGILNAAWLAVVAYTWIGPLLYQRMLKQELDEVRLRPDL